MVGSEARAADAEDGFGGSCIEHRDTPARDPAFGQLDGTGRVDHPGHRLGVARLGRGGDREQPSGQGARPGGPAEGRELGRQGAFIATGGCPDLGDIIDPGSHLAEGDRHVAFPARRAGVVA